MAVSRIARYLCASCASERLVHAYGTRCQRIYDSATVSNGSNAYTHVFGILDRGALRRFV